MNKRKFKKTINDILNSGTDIKKIANYFGASITTVEHWRDGEATVHPLYEKQFYATIKRLLGGLDE